MGRTNKETERRIGKQMGERMKKYGSLAPHPVPGHPSVAPPPPVGYEREANQQPTAPLPGLSLSQPSPFQS